MSAYIHCRIHIYSVYIHWSDLYTCRVTGPVVYHLLFPWYIPSVIHISVYPSRTHLRTLFLSLFAHCLRAPVSIPE